MDTSETKSIVEAVLFSAGRVVEIKELMSILEMNGEDIDKLIKSMKTDFEASNRGIEIIKVDNGYQLCSKKEYYEYIYPLFDNRAKPTLSRSCIRNTFYNCI